MTFLLPGTQISQWEPPVVDLPALLSTNQVYLDLGGALAAFGLIFAVYQLRKPKWEIVLRIRDKWQRDMFWWFGGVGLSLILVRVILATQVPPYLVHYPWNNFALYEILAYIFFVISPLSLFLLATRSRGLFGEKTPWKFYEVMIQEVARSGDERVSAVLDVLLANFKYICKAAKNSSTDSGKAARAVLDVVLSDESIVRLLTTKRLDGLFYIFSITKEESISRQHAGIGIHKLVKNLFRDKESFLYKQLDRDGLALSANVYELIFGSPVTLTNFNLFGYPTLDYTFRANRRIEVDVLIKTLSKAIETYLKNPGVPPRSINEGLSHLSDTLGHISSKLITEEGRGVDTKYSMEEEWSALNRLTNFFGHDYPFLAYQDTLDPTIKEAEKTSSKNASFSSNNTINEGIAAALYQAFEQLSGINKSNDIYHLVIDLLSGMMNYEEYKEGYRDPFEKRIWIQIARNVKGKYYPDVLRAYLTFIGFCVANDRDDTNTWIGRQTERMRRLLYVDLKPLIEAGENMVNEQPMKDILLPDVMSYKEGKFTYKMGFGKGEEKIIAEPPAGSTSAIAGIDLNERTDP